MAQKYQTYLLFGAPGCGKGTQGKTIGMILGYHHLACGDVFRSLDTQTPLGKAFLEYSSRGALVPDDLTVQLWQAHLQEQVATHRFNPESDILVLDGIPRNVAQAKIMEDLIHVRRLFHLACPDLSRLAERLKKRALKENRLDDASDEVIKRRLATYEAETRPVLDFYGQDKIVQIDAMQPPLLVLRDIIAVLVEDSHAAV